MAERDVRDEAGDARGVLQRREVPEIRPLHVRRAGDALGDAPRDADGPIGATAPETTHVGTARRSSASHVAWRAPIS